jgi:hypothetical protein
VLNRSYRKTHGFTLAPKALHCEYKNLMIFFHQLLAFGLAFVLLQVLTCMLYSLPLSMYMTFEYIARVVYEAVTDI